MKKKQSATAFWMKGAINCFFGKSSPKRERGPSALNSNTSKKRPKKEEQAHYNMAKN